MVSINPRRLEDTNAYSAGATLTWDLPRDRYVQQILLWMYLDDVDQAVAAGDQTDYPKVFDSVRIVLNGNITLVSAEGEDLFQLATREYKEQPYVSASAAVADAQALYCMIPIPFMLEVDNPYDFSALIPAQGASSFQLFVVCGDLNALDSNTTVNSGTFYVEMKEVNMTTAESDARYGKNLESLARIQISQKIHTITSTTTNYSGRIDVPTGNYVRKILLRTKDSSAVESDVEFDTYRFFFNPGQQQLYQNEWVLSRAEDKLEHQIDFAELWSGYVLYDPEQLMGNEKFRGSLNLTGMKNGDLQLQYNTGTGGADGFVVMTSKVYNFPTNL